MPDPRPLTFKIATDPSEFEQIFRLGYETFVEEIPQHPANADRRHVDRFHNQNTYVVAVDQGRVVGMLALRDRRPFSLDEKLGSVDPYLPPGRRICELRLLAVERAYRRGFVFRGLVDRLLEFGLARGLDLAIISGTLRQEKLYRHLGFIPFGPLVGTAEASFQPMYIPIERLEEAAPVFTGPHAEPLSFLPGPVSISHEVRAAFERAPVSHRDGRFKDDFAGTGGRLCRLVNARHVQILVGSGTLANDVVCAQLTRLDAAGVVLSNGEFGDRLIDHAQRMSLEHVPVRLDWGRRFDLHRVEDIVARTGAGWIWAVASETSTGMLNDVERLKALAGRHDARLCLDCVSAVGAVPLDLDGVWLASGASGKALASFPGLSMVFHAEPIPSEPLRLPRYLDLGYYAEKNGIPFTHSSNLMAALATALDRFDRSDPIEQLAALSEWIRPRLRGLGFSLLVDDETATPAIVTIVLPPEQSAKLIGDCLQQRGLLVAYQSEYLLQRNWLQIGLMGHCTEAGLTRLLGALAQLAPNPAVQPERVER